MNTLSVCIITLNEEKNIERCLQSIKKVADEIIVVDSFSTDGTELICRKFGVQFIQQKFLGYIEQKNFALLKATKDFVLSIDADEALSEKLQHSLYEEKRKGFSANAYIMNRCTNFCGKWIKHGTWYPDKKIRLFKNGEAEWGGINPHDKINLKHNIKPQPLNGDLLHYSYSNIEDVIKQGNSFTTIQAAAMNNNKRKARIIHLFINPTAAFLQNYFFKRGFLDGKEGFFIAANAAHFTLVKYYKLLMLQKKH
ncbi:MAG: glycosyltransferase family 2 protein [Sphingobacteriia bacterium]|nr:glycosyltransferase family 2 protein [Sphingobacteriia bacterium]